MSIAQPTKASRRRFLGLGAAGLLTLPVAAAGLVGYPARRSRGCSGPPVGGNSGSGPTTTTPTQQNSPTVFRRPTDGFGRGGGDHQSF
jgi:hypothetical protein